MAIDRRTFIKSSVASGLALSVPNIIRAGSGKTYRTALIGSGWWGMNIADEAIKSGRCKMVALCDVDRRHLDPAAEKVESLTGDQPGKVQGLPRAA